MNESKSMRHVIGCNERIKNDPETSGFVQLKA